MDRHLINSDENVLNALRRLNDLSGSTMTLIVVDNDGAMVGTLTDGDIRRSLVAGCSLSQPVSDIMNRSYTAIYPGNVDVAAFKGLRQKGIKLVPMLDSDNRPTRLIDLEHTRSILPLSALIMAGGQGERLRPMTLTTPKPLLKIADKAIIDYNVEALAEVGITDVTVSTRYLSQQIIDHFEQPVAGIKVNCIVENRPLGTIGALGLIGPLQHDNILVLNSDLLTTIDYADMYLKHIDEHADITIAAIPYSVAVPYAILATDGNRVTAIEEKPTYSHYANAGIYIISRKAASLITPSEHIDATDLIERALQRDLRVAFFPLNGTWIDVGSPADFAHACAIMKYHKSNTQS
jgi:dTDP-glucose pyrophosphorylase/CBS domain-containing protein